MKDKKADPNPTPSPSADELMIKQLQAELDSRGRLTEAADNEIKRCWEAYKRALQVIGVLLVIATGIVAFFGIRAAADLKETTHNAMTNAVAKVQAQVKEELERQFAKEEIQRTIKDSAKERIELVADRLIQSNISQRISPIRTELLRTLADSRNQQEEMRTNLFAALELSKRQQEEMRTTFVTMLEENKKQQNIQMDAFLSSLRQSQTAESNLQAVIVEATNTVLRLNQDSDFVTKALRAANDDRAAYEAIRNLSHDSSSRNATSAALVATKVVGGFYSALPRAWMSIPWEMIPDATNRFSWSIERINQVWTQIASPFATEYINFVWNHTNITKEQRISFLRNAYLKDSRNSLQGADTAATSVSKEFQANYNPPFDYSDIEKHWFEYSRTNHLFTTTARRDTNVVYDIVPLNSTNRVVALRDWGKTKLLLFKLKYPAVPKSIKGMYISYSSGLIQDLMLHSDLRYKDCIGMFCDDWDSENIKCEFQYERDLSATNVQTISVTTNGVILDGSVVLPIPLP